MLKAAVVHCRILLLPLHEHTCIANCRVAQEKKIIPPNSSMRRSPLYFLQGVLFILSMNLSSINEKQYAKIYFLFQIVAVKDLKRGIIGFRLVNSKIVSSSVVISSCTLLYNLS